MDRKIKLAAQIKNAVKHLATGYDVVNDFYYPDRYEYSCDAVRETWGCNLNSEFDGEFDEFVDACGLDYYTTKAFVEFYDAKERQQARAIWITMLYLIRKDYEDGVIDL